MPAPLPPLCCFLPAADRHWRVAELPPSDAIATYHAQAAGLAEEYETLDPTAYRATFAAAIAPGAGRVALDVGAGSGRDAAWLASLGYDVVAAEPAAGMRAEAARRHPAPSIRWLDDRLPALDAVHALGLSFDLILLSAVWQHVSPGDRARAFRKLATLMKPGGTMVLTLRHGPAPPDRPMHAVSVGEVEALAREHGLSVGLAERAADAVRRPGVSWTTVRMTLPDDGGGALPLLRGIILNDDKSATYKLGLLRALARVADMTPSLAVHHPVDDAVDVPLGAVALAWVRLYLPLVARKLPQTPRNSGPDGLSFAKEGFRALLSGGLAPADLRPGSAFADERAVAVAGALAEAARTIATMPASHIHYPNSNSLVFGARTTRARRAPRLTLDAETLGSFGTLSVPGHVWRAMQRLSAWIEPVLAAEWARLVSGYAQRQSMPLRPGEVEAALAWTEPTRDVRVAREVALAQLSAGDELRCVWSDRRLDATSLDIDHCLPWSAWPCGDLWNLLPAHRVVNQREKRDLLPSAARLAAARDAIEVWWDTAWRGDGGLEARFVGEAAAALPTAGGTTSALLFEGLVWRRLRLQQDQQLREWTDAAG